MDDVTNFISEQELRDSLFEEYGDINIGGSKRISPHHRKSHIFKLDLDIKSENNGHIPNEIIVKIYERNVFGEGVYKKEYETEKAVLRSDGFLRCGVGKETVRIYPKLYDWNDNLLILIREYVPEESLLINLMNREGGGRWEDVKGILKSVALLHENTELLKNRLGKRFFSKRKMSCRAMGRNFAKHFSRLAYALSREEIDEGEKQEIADFFSYLAQQSVFNLCGVINADLVVNPQHVTNSLLIDAGNTCIGPLSLDICLYSNPIFNRVKDEKGRFVRLEERCEKSIAEYLRNRDKRLSRDFLAIGWGLASIWGLMRGSSAASVDRISEEKSEEVTQKLEEEITKYFENISNCFSLLKDLKWKNLGILQDKFEQKFGEGFKFSEEVSVAELREYAFEQNQRSREQNCIPIGE